MYTSEQRLVVSKRLEKCNLNFDFLMGGGTCTTYWCRVFYSSQKKHNEKQHVHSHDELHVCLSGSCKFELENQEILLERGRFLWLPANEKHRIVWESEDFSKFLWAFTLSDEQAMVHAAFLYPLRTQDFSDVLPLMIDAFMFNDNPDSQKACLYAIFLYIQGKVMPTEEQVFQSVTNSEQFKRIRTFIEDNIENGLSIQTVCKQFYLGEKQLSRICLDNCDMPLGKLIKHIRFEKIRFLLKNTDLRIKEIAEKVGYKDEFIMSKAFKAVEGISPRYFRERVRGESV